MLDLVRVILMLCPSYVYYDVSVMYGQPDYHYYEVGLFDEDVSVVISDGTWMIVRNRSNYNFRRAFAQEIHYEADYSTARQLSVDFDYVPCQK